MQPQPSKSIGGAIVDVFDAALALVKTELRLLSKRVGNIIKAKGIGVVLLLAAAAPLSLALIFLILALFYGLIALGLPTWASALIIAVLALVVTGVLVLLGIRRLTAPVPDETKTSVQQAQDEVKQAEKQVGQAEKKVEKDEKRVEKAERNLERAQSDLQHETSSRPGEYGRGSGTPSSGSSTSRSPSSPTSFTSPSSPASTSASASSSSTSVTGSTTVITPREEASVREQSVREQDGIPVSTQPQLPDQEDRR